MLTLEQIKAKITDGTLKSQSIDGRDFARLADFFPTSDWNMINCEVDTVDHDHIQKPWNEETVLEALRQDVAFGFEKALDKRGLSASAMNAVLRMWMVVLEDPLADQNEELYAQYGLPYIKAIAVKYGFPNPIGDDKGSERKYAASEW